MVERFHQGSSKRILMNIFLNVFIHIRRNDLKLKCSSYVIIHTLTLLNVAMRNYVDMQ